MSVAEYEVYKRIKLLGEGAFGKAFLVECIKDNSLCVIKQVDLNNMPENEKRETIKEAKILEALKHPNIVRFREVYKTRKGKLCIVMDFADGGDLTKHINGAKGSSIPESQIIDWFTQICLAMKHVHDRKILHRDLKCQNIFLTKTGIIKLGDFGIARVLNSTKENARTMVGTPYYLSPEIIDNKPYSFKSDIWSLGVVLYELCALKPPFDAESLPKLAMRIVRGNYNPVPSQYSRELKNLIGAMLTLDPQKRPSVHQILKMPIITNRIKSFLSESVRIQEFSHTILHNKKVVDPRMRFDEIKQVLNEAPMPPAELKMHMLQEKKQKEYQERLEKERADKIEREKMERERIEKDRAERDKQQRLERERLEREKMERGRRERERLEQGLREQENKLLGKNRLKLFENEAERSPFSRDRAYGNKVYMPHMPFTPGPDILSRNKPEVYGVQQPFTPNPDRNIGLFRRDDLKRNEVKPVLYAAPIKEIVNEARRDVSPLKNYLAAKNEAQPVNNSNQKAEKVERAERNSGNDENILNVFRVEESRSDKSDRAHKDKGIKDGPILTRNKPDNSSSFKAKAQAQREQRENLLKRREQQQAREAREGSGRNENSRGQESERSEKVDKGDKGEKVKADIKAKRDEERKKMREDIILKKKSFRKEGGQVEVEVYMPTPSMDDDKSDDSDGRDDGRDDDKIVDVKDMKKKDVVVVHQDKEIEQENEEMEAENLIDMIQEMQQIVDEASEKETESEEPEGKHLSGDVNVEDREDDDEDEDVYNYQQKDVSPLKEISNNVHNNQNISTGPTSMTLKGFIEEGLGKEDSSKVLENSKQMLAAWLDDVNLPVEDYSRKLRDQLCENNPNMANLGSMAYVVMFQSLAEMM